LWIGPPLVVHGHIPLKDDEAEAVLKPNVTPHLSA
jgi:hypothetical protein